MLRSLKELQGYTISATDGDIGSVHDFYFDDQHWTVRYLVVDTGGWLSGRRVLISPMALGQTDWLDRRLPVSLTRQQVEDSPPIDLAKPVSRQYEVEYFNYYGWPYYWYGPAAWGAWAYPNELAAAQTAQALETARQAGATATGTQEQERADPHLRSVKEVTGYRIQATDDEIGHVEDFIADDESWQIRYLVVDTSNWWFGKQVLLARDWIRDVSWLDQKLYVDLTRDQVKGSPAWDPTIPVNRVYEERLYDYYGRPAYWR